MIDAVDSIESIAAGYEMSRQASFREYRKIEYLSMPVHAVIAQSLAPLRDSLHADYAIVFLEPDMTGNKYSHYSGQYFSQSMDYTADVRFQI